MKRYSIVKTDLITRSMYDSKSFPVLIEGTDYAIITLFEEHPESLSGYTKYTEANIKDAIDKIKASDFTDHKESTSIEIKTKELVQGVDYDRIDISYPSTSSEVFTYSKGGSDVLTVTTTYQTDSKRNITSVVFS